ncbi:MAG TPA: hypothetical protein VI603_13225 [Saprospiraceae bacterium]|nr:hypothetical protein [Saprospiraceae bacterium]
MVHIQLDQLPGWELVRKGLDDLRQGDTDTIEAILVMMAMPRLRPHTEILLIPAFPSPDRPLNIALYKKLEDFGNSAHARYNALRRRVLKFCTALDQYDQI